MRWLKLVASGVALAAWLAGSVAQQQGAPPAGTPPPSAPPAGTPRTPPASTPQPEKPPEGEKEEAQQAAADAEEDFIPTEELQPDAAVTFPVDI